MANRDRWTHSAGVRLGAALCLVVFGVACDRVTVTTPQPAQVSLTSSQVSLSVGESVQLTATVKDVNGNTLGGQSIRWSSAQPNVANVSPDGTIQGIGVGTTVVTATSGSASAAAAVTVGPAVGFGLDRTEITFTTALDGRAGPETVLVSGSTGGSTAGLSLTTQYLGAATGWLDVSLSSNSTPSSVVISADAQGLAAGDYSARVMISAAGAASQTVLVNLKVTNAPAIGLSRNSARFEVQQNGAAPAPQNIDISNLGGGSLASLSATVTFTTGQPGGWLSASLQGSVAPTILALAAQQGSLGPGTYNATVRVSSSGAANSPVDLPVTLVVSATSPQPRISLTDSVVTIVGTQGKPSPAPFVVNISNGGGGTLSGLQAVASFAPGQPVGWLSTNLSSGSAPSALTLGAQTGSLQAGTYQASVEVAGTGAINSPRYITVLFTVDPPPTLAVAPATGSFSASVGGTNPAAKTFAISNGGGATIAGLSTSITYGSGSGWLSASLSSTSAPSTLTLNAALGSLAQGTYTATVRISSADATNSPLSLPVTFTVGPSASGITISPTSLSFVAVRGGPNPAPKTGSVTNSGGLPLTGLTVSAGGYTGGAAGWATTTLSATTAPSTLTVSPQTMALPPGTYNATVSVASPVATNSPQNVALTVAVPGVALAQGTVNTTVAAGGSSSSTVGITNAGGGSLSAFAGTVAYGAGATGWLTPTFSGNTMTLVASAAGLSAGNSYQATVTVKAAEDAVGAQVTVQMTVTSPPAIGLSPANISLFDTAAPGPITGSITVANVGAGTLSGLSTAVSYSAGGSGWLNAVISSTTAPATINLTATPTLLPAGTYNATVTVSSSSTGVNNNPSVAAVTLTVGPRPSISASPTTVAFTASQGGANPAAKSVAITNSGTGVLNGLATSVTYGAGGSGWLTATPSGSTAPATISLNAATGTLAAGTYTATVNVTSSANRVTNSPQSVSVAFTVGAPPSIGLTPGSMTFAGTAGGGAPPKQSAQVTNTGGGVLSGLTVDSIVYASGAGWLSATLNGTTAPSTLDVSPTPATLAAGSYDATVYVGSLAGGVSNSPQKLTVKFDVTPASSIGISSANVADTVSEAPGTPGTASSVVNVTDGGTPVSGLSATITYGTGAGWLSATLSTTTTPATLTLQSSAGSLAPGNYAATVLVASTVPGTTARSVSINLLVQPAPSISLGGQAGTTLTFGAAGANPTPALRTVNITNAGGGLPGALTGLAAPIAYLPVAATCTAAATGWLAATLDQTTSPAVLTIQPSVGALVAGTYCAGVQVTSPTGKNSPQAFLVEFTIP